jgi:hypothetical protein
LVCTGKREPRCLLALALLLAAPAFGQPAPEPPKALSASRLALVPELRKNLGLSPAFDGVRDLSRVKIAILDYGFEGIDGKRPYLPDDAVVVEHYDPEFVRRFNLGDPDFRKGFEAGNVHGRLMAQIVWGVTGSRPEGPKFLLLNANGPTMFRRAVRYAIDVKADIILFSGVFEGAGNYDGRGPIGSIVDDAIHAGILWINASGNFGGSVYNGPVNVRSDGYLQLGRDGLALEFRNLLDENTVTITLTWNDYKATEDAGTSKDLDLYVEDAKGNVIGKSELRQIAAASEAGAGRTLNPRERVILPALGASEKPYRIRIKRNSGTFTESDRIRVLVQGSRLAPAPDPKTKQPVPALQFTDSSHSGEVFPPADHPRVITVGDGSPESSIGPTLDYRLKPDVVIPDSDVAFTNGEGTNGSSNSAAFLAAVAVTLKAAEPSLRGDHLLRYVSTLRSANKPLPQPSRTNPAGLRDLSLQALVSTGYGPILDRVQGAVGNAPVRLWLNAEGRVVLGVPQRPVDLRTIFPNHPFPDHAQLSNEYECYLGLVPGPRNTPQIVDTYRLRLDSPSRAPNAPVPRMAPNLVEVRQIPQDRGGSLEERTRILLLDRRWVTPSPDALASLVRVR